MAGALTISTLNNDTGILATQNGMSGIPKAWVNMNGTDATIRSSFNVSSVTRTATGLYTITFTNAMPNTNYSTVCTTAQAATASSSEVRSLCINSGVSAVTGSISVISKRTISGGTTADIDTTFVMVAVFSL